MKLGVNIDHVATLRQARGTEYPSVREAGLHAVEAGAHGITVHLREDRRHIQDQDVLELKECLSVPLNLEMANSAEIIAFGCDLKPAEVCLVPEKREELTTEGGLDVVGQREVLRETVARLAGAGCEVSLFIEADEVQIRAAADIGAPVIELHTGTFCDAVGVQQEAELARLQAGARLAEELGLVVNAGHGISMSTIGAILRIPHLNTLNIGHSIVARSVFVGLAEAVREMVAAMAEYRGGHE